MEAKRKEPEASKGVSPTERIIALLGAILFGLGTLWISNKLINCAIQAVDESRYYALLATAAIAIVCGAFVLLLGFRRDFLSTRTAKGEHKEKNRALNADKIMIIASLIVIALMAVYIYISEGLGVKG